MTLFNLHYWSYVHQLSDSELGTTNLIFAKTLLLKDPHCNCNNLCFFRKSCFFPKTCCMFINPHSMISLCVGFTPQLLLYTVYPAIAMTKISISGLLPDSAQMANVTCGNHMLLGIILHITRNWEPIPALTTSPGTPWDPQGGPLGPACTQSMPSQTPRSMFPTWHGLT